MNKTPKLSIITPVFNGERFIESCLKVFVDQNCKEAEHIIIDGGSTDKTVELIKGYAKKYDHIRWVSEKDKGQSDAMNKGIRMASGAILGILNVDDYYEINTLNRILDIFPSLKEPAFLVGNCNVWNDNNTLIYLNKPKKLRIKDLLLGFHINPFPVNPTAYFYHKSLHEEVGHYSLEEHYCMDVDFIMKALKSANVKYIDEMWGNFRLIEGTKTFDSQKSGKNDVRVAKYLDRELKGLSKWQQLNIMVLRYLIPKVDYPVSRIKHFVSKPAEIIPFCLKKIKGAFVK